MMFKRFIPKVGDTFRISDHMSIRFEKIADDLKPVWHEIPPSDDVSPVDEGTYVAVTADCWFVFDRGKWRMMGREEHIEASRQTWLNFRTEEGF